MYVTLDGFHAGPAGDIDWHVVDDEMNAYFIDQLTTMDTLLFGRVTYQGMASYWPTPAAAVDNPIVTEMMNTLPKVVFSTTLDTVEWGTWTNIRLVRAQVADEVARMKRLPGKDMVIMGSATLVQRFAAQGLMDEYRIVVNPVVLGRGQPFFAAFTDRLNLTLLEAKAFGCGNVLLRYQPAGLTAER
jgi:dihydrofolate reductase